MYQTWKILRSDGVIPTPLSWSRQTLLYNYTLWLTFHVLAYPITRWNEHIKKKSTFHLSYSDVLISTYWWMGRGYIIIIFTDSLFLNMTLTIWSKWSLPIMLQETSHIIHTSHASPVKSGYGNFLSLNSTSAAVCNVEN